MLPYIAESLGTMIPTILSDDIAVNVMLSKSDMRGTGSIQITSAWDPAVMLPAFIFGATSGTYFNPTLTIALAVDGGITWEFVPGYIVAQFAGVFVDAAIVYLLFRDQYDTAESTATKLGTFRIGPSAPNTGRNILSGAVGTFVLTFAIKGIGQVTDIAPGTDKLLVFGIVVPIGISLGGLAGYAINPACDLRSRFTYAVLPIEGKGDSDRSYAPVVTIGPVVGAAAAVLLYQTVPWM